MTAKEFDVAWKIAQSDVDLTGHDDSPLFGCGCPDFQGARVSLYQVARLLRWQCICLDGISVDQNELANMRHILVRRGRGKLIEVEMSGSQCVEYLSALAGERLAQ